MDYEHQPSKFISLPELEARVKVLEAAILKPSHVQYLADQSQAKADTAQATADASGFKTDQKRAEHP